MKTRDQISIGDVVQITSKRSAHGVLAVVVGVTPSKVSHFRDMKPCDFDEIDLEWIGDDLDENPVQTICDLRFCLTYIGKAAVRPSTGEPFDVEGT